MKRTLILLVAGLASLTTLIGQNSRLVSSIDSLLDHCHNNRLFNGVALVAQGDSVLFESTYGYAVMEWDIPLTIDTKFRIASCTKQFTAMLIMQLVAEKKIQLHVPIATYLPEIKNSIVDSISIHHLLSHTSGLPSWKKLANGDLSYWYSDISKNDIMTKLESSKLAFSPGSRFQYGSIGYPLLSVIISSIDKSPYPEVLNQRILQPLAMNNSGYNQIYELKKNYAFAYENWDFGYNVSEFYNPSHAIGASGMYSTLHDLLTWSRALTKNVLLNDSLTQLMFTPVTYRHYEGYGYGWYIGHYEFAENGKRIYYQQHSGGMPGHTSLITRIPEKELTVVLLNNTGHARLELINYEMLRIIEGFQWEMRKSLGVELNRCQTVEQIRQVEKEFYINEEAYFEGENELCGLVYNKLRAGENELGEAIYRFAIDLYPNSVSLPAYRDSALQKRQIQ